MGWPSPAEIRNFSVESRWTTTAHISGVVGLVDAAGKVPVEKAVSEREVPGMWHGVFIPMSHISGLFAGNQSGRPGRNVVMDVKESGRVPRTVSGIVSGELS